MSRFRAASWWGRLRPASPSFGPATASGASECREQTPFEQPWWSSVQLVLHNTACVQVNLAGPIHTECALPVFGATDCGATELKFAPYGLL